MSRQRACAVLVLCGCVGPLLVPPGCSATPGYRDQFYNAVNAPAAETGTPGITMDSVRLEEWLSAYRYPLPAANSSRLYAAVGASAADRAAGRGWLLLAVVAGKTPVREQLPRRWVLVLDNGDGMKGERWGLAIKAARRLVDTLSPSDRVCLVEAGSDQPSKGDTGWLNSVEAARELAKRERGPANGFHDDAPLTKFGEPFFKPIQELERAAPDTLFDRAVLLFTDGTGSEKQELKGLTGSVRIEVDAIALTYHRAVHSALAMHVIGLPSGDETSLLTLARAAGGSFVYLAGEGDIERQIVERRAEFFDTVCYQAATGLRTADGTEDDWTQLGGPRYPDGYDSTYRGGCGSQTPPHNPWINARNVIRRMGPGETWARVYPVPLRELPLYTARQFVLTGTNVRGDEFKEEIPVAAGLLNLDHPVTPAEKTLCKALAIRAEVELLRKANDPALQTNLPAQAAAVCQQLRAAQALLSDSELTRDLLEWEAISRMTPQDMEHLRKEFAVRLSPTQYLHRGAKIAGVAVGATSVLVVAGVVIVPVGIPYLVLSKIFR